MLVAAAGRGRAARAELRRKHAAATTLQAAARAVLSCAKLTAAIRAAVSLQATARCALAVGRYATARACVVVIQSGARRLWERTVRLGGSARLARCRRCGAGRSLAWLATQ